MPVQKQPVKKPLTGAAATSAAGDEQPEQAAPPVKRKAVSLSAAFDEAKPGGGFMEVGTHRAFITEFVVEEPNDKGHSAKITYEGSDQSENEAVHGKEISQWYQLLKKDGSPGQGLGFLKRDLETLGYADVAGDDLEDVLAEIMTNRPEVIINVKRNGQYTNAYLQGLVEGEE
jgi:hypothetical protein